MPDRDARPSPTGRDPDLERAEIFVRGRLSEAERADAEVVPLDAHREGTGTTVTVSVLRRAPDLVTFFDGSSRSIGWRDDGRLGVAIKPTAPADTVWPAVRSELELNGAAQLASAEARFLDPIGWAYEFRVRVKGRVGTDAWRVWASPESGKIIQLLKPPAPADDRPLPMRARLATIDLLEGRLRRARLSIRPLHRYFVLRPGAVEPFPGGNQVRIATWRHWSDAWVRYEAGEPEPSGWRVDRFADPVVPVAPTAAAITGIAASLVPPPSGASRAEVAAVGGRAPYRAWRVTWRHEHEDIPVEGDFIEVDLQPDTRRLVGVRRVWREVKPNRLLPVISETAAIVEAEKARAAGGFDDSLLPGRPYLTFVRVEAGVDRLAWRVPFADGAGTVDFLVDAETQLLLGVRSRR